MRTSQTHPLRIDEVQAGQSCGIAGITFCPGKQGDSYTGAPWARDLDTDLAAIARWGARAVVTLIEDHEFEMLGVQGLGDAVRARGIEWHHLPIVDVQPPDTRFESGWATSGPRLRALLDGGAKVLVHCRGGLGRAGTVAALLLLEMGVDGDEAVRRVRAARPGAIETAAQMEYVIAAGRLLRSRPADPSSR